MARKEKMKNSGTSGAQVDMDMVWPLGAVIVYGHSTRQKSNQHLGLLSGGQNPGVTFSRRGFEKSHRAYITA